MKSDSLLLYAVTDSRWLNGKTLTEAVKESLDGGVTFVQIREKDLDEKNFTEEALQLQSLCREYNVPFVVNDNVDIALKINADGVHVGQSDIKGRDIRAMIGPDKILGISAGTVAEAVAAEKAGADYIGVGAVFGVYYEFRNTVQNSFARMMMDESYTPSDAVEEIVATTNENIELYNEANPL